MLRTKDFRKQLLQCGDTEQLQDLIMSQSYVEDETPPRRPGMKMMHVFVRNEDIFDDLLQVFASSESISALVVETHESTDFLMKSPLFAGFWNTDIRRFNRLIVAVVRDELVNATVRNIEYICGKLSERDDILLTVTDLHYVLGSLGG
jgi:hypothetical protein